MKVLLLNNSDNLGGAAIAANRLMNALITNGIETKTLVLNKKTDDENVVSVKTFFTKQLLASFYFLWERFIIFIYNRLSRKNLFKISIANAGFDVSKHFLVKNADIIHLHWINQGFLSLRSIKKLIKLGKPIVWTMHDMWNFTGICHHAQTCLNYTQNCGNCHYLKNPKNNDISYTHFNRKKKIYSNAQLFPVTCSNWLRQAAEKSELLRNKPIISIPNPIDIEIFKPCCQVVARHELSLPKEKKIILFGAANINDNRKGLSILLNVFKQMVDNQKNIELVVFGKTTDKFSEQVPSQVHILNYVSNNETLVNLYNAADVFVHPSLDENLPNTIMEALACGLPVVAFQTGGIPEMITHKENGYLVPPENESELAKGIEYMIDNDNDTIQNLRINARNKVETNYDPQIIAKQYEKLYSSILEK